MSFLSDTFKNFNPLQSPFKETEEELWHSALDDKKPSQPVEPKTAPTTDIANSTSSLS